MAVKVGSFAEKSKTPTDELSPTDVFISWT
jgi:hypothetical protein